MSKYQIWTVSNVLQWDLVWVNFFGLYANHATKAPVETLASNCIPGSVTSILSGLAFG